MIAGVCLHDAQDVRIRETSLSSRAQIHATGYDVEVIYGSDVIPAPDWAGMASACADDVCISYHKWCRDDGLFCRYHFGQPGEMQDIVIEITAHDRAGMQRSEGGIGVMTLDSWKTAEVPLTRFSVTSPSEDAPYCNPRPAPACWPVPSGK
jgi:hypothetical protein